MRRSSVLAAVALGTLTATMAAPAWASVDTTVTLRLAASGWSWAPPGGVPVPASAVGTAGDLVVGYAGDSSGAPSAKAYLGLDFAEVPTGAALLTAPLALTLDPAARSNVQPAGNTLRACLTAGAWVPGEGTDAAKQPKDDCSVSTVGSYDAASGTYRFEVATLLEALRATPERGIVIEPVAGYVAPNGTPFQLSFVAAKTLASAALDLPAAPAPEPTTTTPPPVSPPVSSGGSGWTSSPGMGSGVVAGGPPPSAPQPVVAPVQRPAVLPPVPVSVANRAEIRAALARSNTPPTGFWLAGALGALVLGLVSWAAGDTTSQRRAVRAALRRREQALALQAQRRAAAPVRSVRLRPARTAGTAGTAADLG